MEKTLNCVYIVDKWAFLKAMNLIGAVFPWSLAKNPRYGVPLKMPVQRFFLYGFFVVSLLPLGPRNWCRGNLRYCGHYCRYLNHMAGSYVKPPSCTLWPWWYRLFKPNLRFLFRVRIRMICRVAILALDLGWFPIATYDAKILK